MIFVLMVIGCLVDWETYYERRDFLTDNDKDGFSEHNGDCDDYNVHIFPGAEERCNNTDDDCDGRIDVDAIDIGGWFPDEDGDGFGDIERESLSCQIPGDWINQGGDCDDENPNINPTASEVCNSTDDDCDGIVDEDAIDADIWFVDNDGDGYGSIEKTIMSCIRPYETAAISGDCDDSESSVYPAAKEVCNDGFDNGCDGTLIECSLPGVIDLSVADVRLVGEAGGDGMGISVSGAGDVNGDGLDDVLVGATGEDSGGNNAGAAYLILGGVEGMVDLSKADAKLVGETAGDSAGCSVSGAGDVNGDGIDDLLIGALWEDTGGNNAGATYLVLGGVSGVVDLSTDITKLIGEDSEDASGFSVSGAGDVNSDGLDDLIIGAPQEDFGGSNAGAAYLVLGGVSGIVDISTANAKLVGENAEDISGFTISGAGDVNGDGLDDVLVGAVGEDSGGNNAGAAYLILGGVEGMVDLSTADAKLVGETAGDSAGTSVSGAGDVNGDGLYDLLIGAPQHDFGGDGAGAAYLILGNVSGTVNLFSSNAKMVGEIDYDNAGWSVSNGGDVNGDGLDDLLVGALWEDMGGNSAGAAYLILGNVSGLVDLSVADTKMVGENSGDYAGVAVSGAGDVNGDGLDDLLVGARGTNPGVNETGTTYLILGVGL